MNITGPARFVKTTTCGLGSKIQQSPILSPEIPGSKSIIVSRVQRSQIDPYYIVASTAPHETWKVEDPACPCLCHCLRHCHIIFTTCHLERRVPSLAMSLSLSCLVFVIFLSLSLSLSLSYRVFFLTGAPLKS